jgi:hypothetical protein
MIFAGPGISLAASFIMLLAGRDPSFLKLDPACAVHRYRAAPRAGAK